ncbi:60S ribosomal L19, partial [Paramuricea clavata]
MPQPRDCHGAEAFEDKVLILGGEDDDDDVLDSVLEFDPKKNEFITGNTIVVMGGKNEDYDDLSSVECFTMGGSTWKYLPSMNNERSGAVAEVLPSTRKYVSKNFNIGELELPSIWIVSLEDKLMTTSRSDLYLVYTTLLLVPDAEDKVPDAEDKVPDAEDKVPDAEDKVPDAEDKVPDAEDKVPDAEDKVPDAEDKVPDAEDKVPDAEDKVPDAEDKVPDAGDK